MKQNGYFVKSIVALSLVGTFAMANSVESNEHTLQDVKIESSIQISQDSSEEKEQSLAKIGVDEVAKVVKNKFSGNIIEVKLENENGNLVYTAAVLANNQITDVIVDAGNGKILASTLDKKDKEKDEQDNEGEEAWYKFW